MKNDLEGLLSQDQVRSFTLDPRRSLLVFLLAGFIVLRMGAKSADKDSLCADTSAPAAAPSLSSTNPIETTNKTEPIILQPGLEWLPDHLGIDAVENRKTSISATTNALPPAKAPAEADESNKKKSPAGSNSASAKILSAASVSVSATNQMDGLDDKYRLKTGDRLSWRIVEDREEPKPLIVTDTGELEVPYIGRVMAQDKTCKQLAQELKGLLEKDYYHTATVILGVDLFGRNRGRVYLSGQIRVPGPQEMPSDEVLTVSKAVLRAGGFSDFADRKHVKVVRKRNAGEGKTETIMVNVAEIVDKGRTDHDVPLEPDDMVVVPERAIRF